MKKKRMAKGKKKEALTAYLMLLPDVAGLLIFVRCV